MGDTMNNTEKPEPAITVETIDYIQKLHRWRMAFFGTIILLAGLVIGSASMIILMPHRLLKPPPGPEFNSLIMIPPLRHKLGLTPEQTEKIKPILNRHIEKLNKIRMDARSEVGETLKQMNTDITAILTEEQKQIWQRGLHRLEAELHPGGWRHGEGGRGPRYRRGPGPLGPLHPMDGPNLPRNHMNRGTIEANEPPPNEKR